jgi:hypothetical protein
MLSSTETASLPLPPSISSFPLLPNHAVGAGLAGHRVVSRTPLSMSLPAPASMTSSPLPPFVEVVVGGCAGEGGHVGYSRAVKRNRFNKR